MKLQALKSFTSMQPTLWLSILVAQILIWHFLVLPVYLLNNESIPNLVTCGFFSILFWRICPLLIFRFWVCVSFSTLLSGVIDLYGDSLYPRRQRLKYVMKMNISCVFLPLKGNASPQYSPTENCSNDLGRQSEWTFMSLLLQEPLNDLA